ncbi:hypothetical protein KKQ10_27130 [Pseudomonas sp. MG-9]|uniref:hypothetical protein n=1 Tax=unclassified Pseudomonas TaxID=196821 RepID=UPI0012F47C8B|nr:MULTISPECIES: hypothetical protein [unclassified Pseudomonas]MBT9268556.1 hypothetical protein [Pseudomonas sp. MG-9]
MVAKENVRKEFSKRLHKACDEARVRERGRAVDIQSALASAGLKATTTAIGKWLNSEAMPESEKLRPVAAWLKVRAEWLEYGIEPMRQGEPSADSISADDLQVLQSLFALKGKVTPRSKKALDSIERAALDGRLTEDDLVLLERIAKRFEDAPELNSARP